MADRRKSQNYASLPRFLTETLWQVLATASKEKAIGSLLKHLWTLGLRCPSESTYAVILCTVELAQPNRTRSRTSYERYHAVASLKKDWKQLKKAMKNWDFQYHDYMESLPETVQDLPAEYYLAAFSMEQAVEPSA
eukprot:Skav236710  [mRNA]  locus=scaffold738:447631:448038:+ [translate_table: standard]